MLRLIFIISILAFFIKGTLAQETQDESNFKFLLPTHVRLQYAGGIGLVSAGPAWSIFKNRFEIAPSIGFVPKTAFQSDLYITSLKVVYTPRLDIQFNKLIIKPFSIGFGFSQYMGEKFNRYQNLDLFPKNYYWWKVPYRFALLYQAEIYAKINNNHIKGISFFFEASIWDLNLYSYMVNKNSSYLSVWDITTLGLGSKFHF